MDLILEQFYRDGQALLEMLDQPESPNLGTFEQPADQHPGRRWLEPDEKQRVIEACKPTGHIDYMSITRAVSG